MEAIRIIESPRDRLDMIVSDNGHSADSLISILQDIQSEYHYLPEEALREVAKKLDLPLIQVYGVATFFKAFSLKPKGRHQCTVCMGTACHVRGATGVLEELERKLNIKTGDTTDDMEYSLETVNCVGACALGPMLIIDGEYYPTMNSAKVKKALEDHATMTAAKADTDGEDEEEIRAAKKSKSTTVSPKPRRFQSKSAKITVDSKRARAKRSRRTMTSKKG